MTAYQEPPLSRRAARQSERAESATRESWDAGREPSPAEPAPRPQSGRRAAESAPSAPVMPAAFGSPAPVSSVSSVSSAPSAPAEPLTYMTQNRPNVPSYDGPLRGRAFARTVTDDRPELDVPTQAMALGDRPSYRARDFSPEGRRAAAPVTPIAPPVPPSYAAPASATDIDYYTHGAPVSAPPPASVAPAGFEAAVAAATTPSIPEQTLTRRQLRALREAEAAGAASNGATELARQTDTVEHLIRSGPISLPYLDSEPIEKTLPSPVEAPDAGLAAALYPAPEPVDPSVNVSWLDAPASPAAASAASADSAPSGASAPSAPSAGSAWSAVSASSAHSAASAASVPSAADEPVDSGVDAPTRPFIASASSASSATAPGSATDYPSFTDLIGVPRSEAPPVSPNTGDALADVHDLFGEPSSDPTGDPAFAPDLPMPAPAAPAAPAGQSRQRPFGHWSTQSDDDETQPGAGSGFTAGGSATSALVIPAVPNPSELSYSLSTGEILVTGSIDLPRSLGSTGADLNTLDGPGIDDIFDPGDREVTDSTPVRAARAVSSHTSTRGMMVAKRPRGTKLPTILLIAATAMAVVVGTLVVVSILTGNL